MHAAQRSAIHLELATAVKFRETEYIPVPNTGSIFVGVRAW
jgi:hypothetical protein